MAAKDYPLKIETLHDLDSHDTVSYYSKGHHDRAAFAEAVMEAYGDEVPIEKVEHTFRRWGMFPGTDGPARCLVPPYRAKRGVFPVTIWDWS